MLGKAPVMEIPLPPRQGRASKICVASLPALAAVRSATADGQEETEHEEREPSAGL
jgi:hypothetical protein